MTSLGFLPHRAETPNLTHVGDQLGIVLLVLAIQPTLERLEGTKPLVESVAHVGLVHNASPVGELPTVGEGARSGTASVDAIGTGTVERLLGGLVSRQDAAFPAAELVLDAPVATNASLAACCLDQCSEHVCAQILPKRPLALGALFEHRDTNSEVVYNSQSLSLVMQKSSRANQYSLAYGNVGGVAGHQDVDMVKRA